VTGAYAEASTVLDDLDAIGVSYTEVVDLLEDEGVEKFEKSWGDLLEGVSAEMEKVRA
jgi:transaldolase